MKYRKYKMKKEKAVELDILFRAPLTEAVGKNFSWKDKTLGVVRSVSESRINLITYKPEDVDIVSKVLNDLGYKFYTVVWELSKMQIDNESIKRNF